MGFLDIFRARWKHSNVEVRSDAVRELDNNQVDILLQVARKDSDARVRKIAVKKLEDPWLLKELAESEADEQLKSATVARARELLLALALGQSEEAALKATGHLTEAKDLLAVVTGAPSAQVRTVALSRITENRPLADLARRPQAELSLRLAALARLADPAALAEIAREEISKQVAVEAAGRVDDVAALRTIAQRARCKAARKVAADRLPAEPGAAPKAAAPVAAAGGPSGPSPVELKARRTRLTQLCSQAETWAKHEDLEQAHEEQIDLSREWDRVGHVPRGDVLRRRFDVAVAQLKSRRDAVAREAARAAQLEARAREEAAAKKQRALAEAQTQAERAVLDEAALARKAADEARRAEQLEAREAERRVRDEEKARQNEERRQKDEERRKKDEERKETERLRREEAAQREASELAQLTGRGELLCARLESLVAADDLKGADAALKNATQLLRGWKPGLGDEPTQAVRDRLSGLTDQVRTRMAEVRENEQWKRWADLPPLEQIVKEAEALAEVIGTVEDRRRAPEVVKELRGNWNAHRVAPGKNQELVERFDKALAVVQARIVEDQAEAGVHQAENLKAKELLCEQVQALAESTEWKETSEKIKALQAEWKKVGPVSPEHSDAIWKRFRGACDAFFERRAQNDKSRDEERGKNLKVKEELCVGAEALAGTVELTRVGVDWRKLSEEMKALQKRWQEVGAVPKADAEPVWKRFRGACDRFFSVREEAHKEFDAERSKNLEKKSKLCEQVEALALLEDVDAAIRQCKALQADWKKIGPVARADSDNIWRRFRGACDRVFKGPEMLAQEVAGVPGTDGTGFANRINLDAFLVDEGAAQAAATEAAAAAEEEWAVPVHTAGHTIDPALEEGWDLDGEEHK